MRLGNSAEVQAILELVGRSHALEGVRIFSPSGQILKSAKSYKTIKSYKSIKATKSIKSEKSEKNAKSAKSTN